MSFVMVCFQLGLFCNKVISDIELGLRVVEVFHLCNHGGSQGEGRLGPIGVDLGVWRRWSMEVPKALAVDREVFMVLIWCSIMPLDLG